MNARRNNLWLLALLAVGLTAPLAGGQEIRLRPQIMTAGVTALLADVADVRGLPESVGQIIVARLEKPGDSATVSVSQLQIALRLEGVNIASVSFSGAARCTLHRAADRPAAEAQDLAVPAEKATAAGIEEKASAAAEAKSQAGPTNAGAAIPAGADLPVAPAKTAPLATVASHLQEQLLEQLAARPEEMTLSIAPASRPTAEMVWPAPASITSTDRNILGRRTWRVDYQQNGRPCQRYITGIVHLVRPAVIARRALASGLTLTAGDVECVLREDDGRQERLATLESVVGQQVRRPLAEGQTIAPGDLKSPVLVIRGQLAWVQAGFVQVRAKALGQGAGGEVVEFENVQSKGHVWAQVTGPGTAQVTSAPTQ